MYGRLMAEHAAVGRWSHVVVDCADVERLATFWTAMLAVDVAFRWNQYVMLKAAADGQPALAFQQVPEQKTGKNRVHLDFFVDDLDAAQARTEALGGTRVHDVEQDGVRVRVMADPEGNELCLVKLPA